MPQRRHGSQKMHKSSQPPLRRRVADKRPPRSPLAPQKPRASGLAWRRSRKGAWAARSSRYTDKWGCIKNPVMNPLSLNWVIGLFASYYRFTGYDALSIVTNKGKSSGSWWLAASYNPCTSMYPKMSMGLQDRPSQALVCTRAAFQASVCTSRAAQASVYTNAASQASVRRNASSQASVRTSRACQTSVCRSAASQASNCRSAASHASVCRSAALQALVCTYRAFQATERHVPSFDLGLCI